MSDSPLPGRWHRVEALLDAALALPLEQRDALLDAECHEDGALRAEVERLLRACAAADSFLREPLEDFVAPLFHAAEVRESIPIGSRIGPYRILGEAGRGGMAVVYRAARDDGQFRKRVALKVIRGGSVASEELLRRFLEERQLLADLEHPGIAYLLDGGVTPDGLPWLAMEFVEGTPIDRHCDEHRSSIAERLKLFCAVCDAVQHAHRRGIVHCDLKPGNILVTEADGHGTITASGEARVKLLDFGIARVLSAETGNADTDPAGPGLRMMTPEYASPEQIRGEPVTPATDVHALGVLLYQLLCGRHPFRSAGPRDAIARMVLEALPDPPSAVAAAGGAPVGGTAAAPGIRSGEFEHLRQGDLDTIVLKALSKEPGRRYQDAGQFASALRSSPSGTRSVHRGSWRTAIASLGILVLTLTAWLARNGGDPLALDPALIVVAPFQVTAEGPFGYLQEGLADLLATSLNGGTSSRAVDPRMVRAAWRGAPRDGDDRLAPGGGQRVARALGAGLLLTGTVIGHSERMTINATLYDAATPAIRMRVSAHGPADSLATLVDDLVGQILAREAGLPPHTLAGLTTASLPALRSYLAGRADHRGGRLATAALHLQEALDHDSTFALAALHLALVSGIGELTVPPGTRARALRLAWTARDRLHALDRLLLEALAGPRYPAPTPRHEVFAARTRAVDASPDQPEGLAVMGDFHLAGIVRGEPNALQLSTEYYRRALGLDSSYAWPAYNVVRAAAAAADTLTVRRVVRRYLAADPDSEMAGLLAWIAAAANGDEGELLAIRARMPSMHPTALGWIVLHAMMFGWDMDGAGAALSALRAAVRSEREWGNHRFREWEYLGNQGRVAELWSQLEASARESQGYGPIEELGLSATRRAEGQRAVFLIRTALFWGGDTTGLGHAIELMEDRHDLRQAPSWGPFARTVVADHACFAGMGRLNDGNVPRARVAAARLGHLLHSVAELPNRAHYTLCAATLDALIAVSEGRADARDLIERAESLMRHNPPGRAMMSRTQLMLARAWAEVGDPEAGLRVIRRREVNNPAFFLAALLAEEGRLAALVGDRDGATRAYRHYLALRTRPDPSLVPEVERIRTALAELLAPVEQQPVVIDGARPATGRR